MNHGNKLNHLGRKSAHRKALLRNLTISLIMHKRITTTEAKAKALRVFAEPLFTKSKNDSTHNRRVIFSYLQNKEALIELFATVAPLTPTDLPLKKVPSSRSKIAGLKDSSMKYSSIPIIKPHKYSIIRQQ